MAMDVSPDASPDPPPDGSADASIRQPQPPNQPSSSPDLHLLPTDPPPRSSPRLPANVDAPVTLTREASSAAAAHQPLLPDPASLSSSPRPSPSEITDPVPDQTAAEESGSDSLVEPVTPASGGRHSHDFTPLPQAPEHDDGTGLPRHPTPQNSAPVAVPKTSPLLVARGSESTAAPSAARATSHPLSSRSSPATAAVDATSAAPHPRRPSRGPASSFKRTVSNLFRRSGSTMDRERDLSSNDSPALSACESAHAGSRSPPGRRRLPSPERGLDLAESASPPSPGSPLLLAPTHPPAMVSNNSLPSREDFKKNRASTGLTLRGRAVNFVGATVGRGGRPRIVRRASSFDAAERGHPPISLKTGEEEEEQTHYPPERLPWPLPPDAGTGAKARRMSLILPDDFNVDVVELLSEFEYLHKILGRHGRHLGKGAASKVTLMARKGCPSELYAVKEFRGKSHRESQEEYEKKIKSEFSIAKSLHHPNIVETVRLCTDHHRWNHVMEYCSEGDLFGLVQKGHLKGEDKKKDRLCLLKQLLQGVGYLHANGIAHRDIKLENLLLTKDSKLKITDFGVSEVFSGTHPGLRESGGQCGQNMGEVRLCSPGICGSEPYIAPEVLAKKDKYDPRALDVWSSAVVMIYLTFGGGIWSRAERGNLHYDKLVEGWEAWNRKHTDLATAVITDTDYPTCRALNVGINPPALRRLMVQMLNPDPSRRISMEEVLGNRWMKNVECCQLDSYDDPTQMIDATKKDSYSKNGTKKIYCHSHLPPKTIGSHSLPKMPGTASH